MGLLRSFNRSVKRSIVKSIKKSIRRSYRKYRVESIGEIGEIKVNNKLRRYTSKEDIHGHLNNVIIIDNEGKTHQIDHIAIRKNGIFCIETKNYEGIIFGSANQDKWTQVFGKNNKFQFYNPLKQNRVHIYHLSNALNNEYKINSVVVMVNNNADNVNCSNVINLSDLKNYLLFFNDGTNYSDQEICDIYNKIDNVSHYEITKSKHVENVKNIQHNISSGICPRCGGQLLEKHGKYGTFFGCSNYPNCKFTMKK